MLLEANIHGYWALQQQCVPFLTSNILFELTHRLVVNIVTDVTFAALPIPIVWNLQINGRTRASLITILSLGFL